VTLWLPHCLCVNGGRLTLLVLSLRVSGRSASRRFDGICPSRLPSTITLQPFLRGRWYAQYCSAGIQVLYTLGIIVAIPYQPAVCSGRSPYLKTLPPEDEERSDYGPSD